MSSSAATIVMLNLEKVFVHQSFYYYYFFYLLLACVCVCVCVCVCRITGKGKQIKVRFRKSHISLCHFKQESTFLSIVQITFYF